MNREQENHQQDRSQADQVESRTFQYESGPPNPIQQHLYSGKIESGLPRRPRVERDQQWGSSECDGQVGQ